MSFMTASPNQGESPSQTVGPYFTMRLWAEGESTLVNDATPGTRIRINGVVLDGDRKPIEDALVEIWQANADGRYAHPADTRDDVAQTDGFTGYGRTPTAFGDGSFAFTTIKPGPVPDNDNNWQAPQLTVIVQARGMLLPAFTRCYFADETAANDVDQVLATVPPPRRHTLIASIVDDRDENDSSGTVTYQFDIRLQGDDETVFFDV
jgi:protocatechuate 3,4-dioxygenase, alpha subunit